jgi:hypothetical protein
MKHLKQAFATWGRGQGRSIPGVGVGVDGEQAPPALATLVGDIGSGRDDLRRLGTCAQRPSAGVAAATP